MIETDPFSREKKPEQRAEMILGMLGLDHGEGYGPSHFTAVSRTIICKAFEQCPGCKSFAELDAAVKSLRLSSEEQASGGECFAKLHAAKLEEEGREPNT